MSKKNGWTILVMVLLAAFVMIGCEGGGSSPTAPTSNPPTGGGGVSTPKWSEILSFGVYPECDFSTSNWCTPPLFGDPPVTEVKVGSGIRFAAYVMVNQVGISSSEEWCVKDARTNELAGVVRRTSGPTTLLGRNGMINGVQAPWYAGDFYAELKMVEVLGDQQNETIKRYPFRVY